MASGRLDSLEDRFELDGRDGHLSIPFCQLEGAAIERGQKHRLHGLPVLELDRASGPPIRIASLQGTAALYELYEQVGRAGVAPHGKAA